MKSLISKAESSSNPMEKVVSLKKLEDLTEKYSLFTTIFMFRIVAMNDSVRDLISNNSSILSSMGGGIDIKTALKG